MNLLNLYITLPPYFLGSRELSHSQGDAPGLDTPSNPLSQRLWKTLPLTKGFLWKRDEGRIEG